MDVVKPNTSLQKSEVEFENHLQKDNERIRKFRFEESEEARECRLQKKRERNRIQRLEECEEMRQSRLQKNKERNRKLRLEESDETRECRLKKIKKRTEKCRLEESDKARECRLQKIKKRKEKLSLEKTVVERESHLQKEKQRIRKLRLEESEEKKQCRLQKNKERNQKRRLQILTEEIKHRLANESAEQRVIRIKSLMIKNKEGVVSKTVKECLLRLSKLKELNKVVLAKQTPAERQHRLKLLKEKIGLRFAKEIADLEKRRNNNNEDSLKTIKQTEKESGNLICKDMVNKHGNIFPCDSQIEKVHKTNVIHFSNSKNIRCNGSIEIRQDERNKLMVKAKRRNQKTHNTATYAIIDETMIKEHFCGEMTIRCKHCDSVNFASEGEFIRKNNDHEFSLCCHKGKVKLEPLYEFPNVLKNLMTGRNLFIYNNNILYEANSRNFFANIRQFNSAFACASFGANIVVPPGYGRYCFKIQGQIYYRTGALKPNGSDSPSFGQIYVLDPETADAVRCNYPKNFDCDPNIMSLLDRLFRQCNPYAQSWRMMNDVLVAEERDAISRGEVTHKVDMVIVQNALSDPRRYNAQRVNEVAMVFVSKDGCPPLDRAFIAIPMLSDEKRYLNYLNPNLDPMLYPILFPRGDLGWHDCIKQWDPQLQRPTTRRVSQLQFYCYRLATRIDENNEIEFNPLLNAGKLTQQYIVDAYTKVEANRLKWIKNNQSELRVEKYKLLEDHLANIGFSDNIPPGRPVVLPSSFQNGPRALMQNYQDAMAIVSSFGKPDLFITFTCNPKWKEITENLNGQNSENRPDLTARVFHLKLKELIHDLTKNMVLGSVVAYVYTIEFQKRGLPHAHILLILSEEDKIKNTEKINDLVSAEIPNKAVNPKLFDTVTNHMMHGPCGIEFINSPCMEKIKKRAHDSVGNALFDEWGKELFTEQWCCRKDFPKDFQEITLQNVNGYPLYRRRRNGETCTKTKNGKRIDMDNRYVVPYNPFLSMKYNAHINVEICSSIKAVKYIFKYVYKGYDCANVEIGVDEIKTYLDCRYVSAPEAMWRLYEFEMHKQSHAIIRLPVHLENEEPIYFQENNEAEAIERAQNRLSKLNAWFKLNSEDTHAANYLYTEIPYHYTWHPKETKWKRRLRNHKIIPRMYTVSPSETERYHLRLLLLHVKGATCYNDLKTITVDGKRLLCDSFQEACRKLGLFDDDSEWENCLRECTQFQMPKQLRNIFAYILLNCEPVDALKLWNDFKENMMEDFMYQDGRYEYSLNRALLEIKTVLQMSHKNCSDFNLPEPNSSMLQDRNNVMLDENERLEIERRISMLNEDQSTAFNLVINSIDNCSIQSRMFYLDGPGGSGKTFLYNTILSFLRSRGDTVLPVAWTGIASTLLIGGQTAHSLFGLPVPITETSTRKSKSKEDDLKIKNAKLILWDEATMVPLYALQAVDRRLREIMNNRTTPFGGKVLLMGGDFRQTLPVVPRAKQTEILETCITKFAYWKDFIHLKLNVNMRNAQDIDKSFSQWLLKLGDGTLPNISGLPEDVVQVPNEFIVDNIVESIFGNTIEVNNVSLMSSRAILCPLNKDVQRLNEDILERLQGESKTYLSVDSALDKKELFESTSYTTEFLNSLTPSGMPPHVLKLKVGAIIMLLRNLDFGLCNGTRLIVKKMHNYSIEAEVLTGNRKGEIVLIPRITLNPSDANLPFILKRKQFPITVSFAMTINKAQGQSLDKVGIYLRLPVFSHGQLYVAFSRATLKSGVKVKILDNVTQGKLIPKCSDTFTPNVVYRSVLQHD